MTDSPLAALVSVLQDDSDVAALTAGRVYEVELPFSGEPAVLSDAFMPVQCVTVAPSGPGVLPQGWSSTTDINFDVTVYGADPPETLQLWDAVRRVLDGLTRRSFDAVALHWAALAGGPSSHRMPDTTWPYIASVWQVLYSS